MGSERLWLGRVLPVICILGAWHQVQAGDVPKDEDRKGNFARALDPATIAVMRFNREVLFELLGVQAALGTSRNDPLELEATRFLTGLLQDKRVIVRLEAGSPGETDRHTFVGYVYSEDGTDINKEILRQGFGTVDEHVSFSRREEFKTYEDEAREHDRGIWKIRKALGQQLSDLPCSELDIWYPGRCGVTYPELLPESKVRPVYPRSALKKRIEGRVVLQAVVSKDGSVRDLVALKSPDPAMIEAAMEAVEQWRYKPALKDGTPVDAHFIVLVDFTITRRP